MKNKDSIEHLPIQVKALAPSLKDPELWKCNCLQECIDRIHLPVQKFKKDGNQWIMEFKHGTIAGEFLV